MMPMFLLKNELVFVLITNSPLLNLHSLKLSTHLRAPCFSLVGRQDSFPDADGRRLVQRLCEHTLISRILSSCSHLGSVGPKQTRRSKCCRNRLSFHQSNSRQQSTAEDTNWSNLNELYMPALGCCFTSSRMGHKRGASRSQHASFSLKMIWLMHVHMNYGGKQQTPTNSRYWFNGLQAFPGPDRVLSSPEPAENFIQAPKQGNKKIPLSYHLTQLYLFVARFRETNWFHSTWWENEERRRQGTTIISLTSPEAAESFTYEQNKMMNISKYEPNEPTQGNQLTAPG